MTGKASYIVLLVFFQAYLLLSIFGFLYFLQLSFSLIKQLNEKNYLEKSGTVLNSASALLLGILLLFSLVVFTYIFYALIRNNHIISILSSKSEAIHPYIET